MMKESYMNTLATGLIAGIVLPVIGSFFFWVIFLSHLSMEMYYSQFLNTDMSAKLISLCCIPNLLLFFSFTRSNRLYSARGVLMATILFGLAIVFIKYIL